MYYIQQTNYKNKILLRSPFMFLRPSCIWSQFLLQLSKLKKSRRTIKIDNFIQFLTLFHVYISVITLSWTNELQLWKITPFTHMIPNTFNAFCCMICNWLSLILGYWSILQYRNRNPWFPPLFASNRVFRVFHSGLGGLGRYNKVLQNFLIFQTANRNFAPIWASFIF